MLGKIIPATTDHAMSMAPNMREAEMIEIADSCGLAPEAALLAELSQSTAAWSWVVDGEVACMFGIVKPEFMSAESYPWFLTTPLVERYARQFARACKSLLPELLEIHPHMVGMVDARYALSVRWLSWLGAKISSPQPWGVSGQLFHKFELGA